MSDTKKESATGELGRFVVEKAKQGAGFLAKSMLPVAFLYAAGKYESMQKANETLGNRYGSLIGVSAAISWLGSIGNPEFFFPIVIPIILGATVMSAAELFVLHLHDRMEARKK